jgi:hypothetical protein
MKKLLLILFFLFHLKGFTQDFSINKSIQKPTKLVLKEDGWFTLSLGTVVLSSTWYIDQKWGVDSGIEKPIRISGLTFGTTISLGLYIVSWKRVSKPKTISKNPRWL